MKKHLAACVIGGLFVFPFAALAEDTDAAGVPPLKLADEILGEVQGRPDYKWLYDVRYDRGDREYEVIYVANDGTMKYVRIDAASGREKR